MLWFQGCSLGCAGCFNPETHPGSGGESTTVDMIADEILAKKDKLEGLTLSGGEPFQQPQALAALLTRIRAESELSILIFSGYTLAEIQEIGGGPEILGKIDVLIDGRYESTERKAVDLQGSANQRIHLLTDRYTEEQIQDTPEAEIHIDKEGNIRISGVAPIRIR